MPGNESEANRGDWVGIKTGLFMTSANALDSESRSPPISRATPIVFVVDDDVSVRKSLELMIGSAGWQPQTFASAATCY